MNNSEILAVLTGDDRRKVKDERKGHDVGERQRITKILTLQLLVQRGRGGGGSPGGGALGGQ